MSQELWAEYIAAAASTVAALLAWLANVRVTKLTGEMQRDVFRHEVRFKKEFDIYEELWRKLVWLLDRVSNLDALVKMSDEDIRMTQTDPKEVREKRFDEVWAAINDTCKYIDDVRPFFPIDVYRSARGFWERCQDSWLNGKYPKLMEDRRQSLEALEEDVTALCEAIRRRIAST